MRRFAGIAFLLLVVGSAGWTLLNRQFVIDWWRIRTFTPSSDVAQLAIRDTLVGRGHDLFMASEPQVQNGSDFNSSCPSKGEKTIVLGCYAAQRIYVYNVTDERLTGVKEVTAAHEMLHAAYERLSVSDQAKVNAMLKPIIDGMTDKRILELIKLYNQQEPGQLYNEMHSILGTEYAHLTPDLEDYYKQYFGNRQTVVGYALAYQQPFTDSQNKLDEYDAQLDALKPQIDQNNASLKQQQADLQDESNRLGQLRAQGNIQAYNESVPGYNAKVASFNQLVQLTRDLVAEYNALVVKHNQEATAQNDLQQSLDSSYQSVPKN